MMHRHVRQRVVKHLCNQLQVIACPGGLSWVSIYDVPKCQHTAELCSFAFKVRQSVLQLASALTVPLWPAFKAYGVLQVHAVCLAHEGSGPTS